MNKGMIILRIRNSLEKEKRYPIKFFLLENQKLIEISRRSRIPYQDDAMKKLTFCVGLQRFRQEKRTCLITLSLVVHLRINTLT
jgi:hypothetical protein